MKFLTTILLSVACLATRTAAQGNSNGNANGNANKNKDTEEFTFTVEATFKGKKIPQNEIKLNKIPPGKEANPGKKLGLEKQKDKDSQNSGVTNRATSKNPTSGSGNWCGSVRHTTSTNQIKLIHAYFQHPTCTKRTGQTYPQAAAQWAGIDGDTWGGALLQSGTVCKFDNATATVRYVHRPNKRDSFFSFSFRYDFWKKKKEKRKETNKTTWSLT